MDRIKLEDKHLNSQINKFIIKQEKLSQENRNEIRLLEAKIELLTSEAENENEVFRQSQKVLAADQKSTIQLCRFSFKFKPLKMILLISLNRNWKYLRINFHLILLNLKLQ